MITSTKFFGFFKTVRSNIELSVTKDRVIFMILHVAQGNRALDTFSREMYLREANFNNECINFFTMTCASTKINIKIGKPKIKAI